MRLSFSFIFALVFNVVLAAGESAKPTAPPPAAGKAPAAAPAPKPEDPADKAPVRNLDEGGVLFSPTIAKNVRKYLPKAQKGTDKREVLFVGPGVAATEKAKLMPSSGGGWTYKAGPESVTKAAITGLELMEELPAVLSGFKPGVVVIVGVAGRPKILPTDKNDWADLATLCLRYGAVPVLAIPASSNEDDPLRWSLRGATSLANVPGVDTRAGSVSERLPPLIKLIEAHIYGAAPASASEPVEE